MQVGRSWRFAKSIENEFCTEEGGKREKEFEERNHRHSLEALFPRWYWEWLTGNNTGVGTCIRFLFLDGGGEVSSCVWWRHLLAACGSVFANRNHVPWQGCQ